MVRRSIRPKKPMQSRAQQVEQLVRSLGLPPEDLMNAVVEGLDLAELIEEVRTYPVSALTESAFGFFLEANEVWQRLTPDQRLQLRGFSLQLLSLGAHQSLQLDRSQTDLDQSRAAKDAAQIALRGAVDHNRLRYEQACHVLSLVVRDEAQIPQLPQTTDSTFGDVTKALSTIIEVAEKLLEGAPPAVRRRAMLYGLTKGYVQALAQMKAEMAQLDRQAAPDAELDNRIKKVEQLAGIVLLLLRQVKEAFDTAHRLDPLIASPQLDLPTAPQETAMAADLQLRMQEPSSVSRLLARPLGPHSGDDNPARKVMVQPAPFHKLGRTPSR